MDWTLALNRNRDALLRVLVTLFAAAGLTSGGAAATLPRHVRCAVLRVLRPVESATRRLIVVAARGLSVSLRPARPAPVAIQLGKGARGAAFPLFDPMKRFNDGPSQRPAGLGPRISVPGFSEPVFVAEPLPLPEDRIDADRLHRRLQTLKQALDDLPRQARRLARWRARRDRMTGPRRVGPLRPGWPPGHRSRSAHEADALLADCHALALHALQPP